MSVCVDQAGQYGPALAIDQQSLGMCGKQRIIARPDDPAVVADDEHAELDRAIGAGRIAFDVVQDGLGISGR